MSKDLNKKADKITRANQRKCNIGRFLVNKKTQERQGNRLGWYVARIPGAVIRHIKNPACVNVSK
jgi:hypothetical protein